MASGYGAERQHAIGYQIIFQRNFQMQQPGEQWSASADNDSGSVGVTLNREDSGAE